ncbi:hypothetical protein [Streptomyces sp. NRRL S-31]|uniref:hypothetical protein n=1 Tax=Streptomyces sp. NRRL S-31 TaxID=1463898 RepID=UPI0004C596D7|nr:hypothetical protein [Streptomyces sp. NRRL S-31]
MKVWRVEHSTANGWCAPLGPYRTSYSALPIKDREILHGMGRSHADGTHRAPGLDPDIRYIDADEVCGLDSREALDTWFQGWHTELERTGFMVSVYEVPTKSVRCGSNGQVVFKAHAAVRVGAEFWEVVQ